MTTYAAFLRSINVGAHNRMKMAGLQETRGSLGLEDVRTYIQSGNIVFKTAETDPGSLETDLKRTIHDKFGYDITVLVRTRAELNQLIERQPFEKPSDGDVALYVTFLSDSPADERIDTL